MPKTTTRFICQSCGHENAKWMGRCPNCEEWNSMTEEVVAKAPAGKARALVAMAAVVSIMEAEAEPAERRPSGIEEFDRVLGGGIVAGGVVLVGGDPGIGKSTLLTQVANHVAQQHGVCLYLSGEESVRQVRLRAQRLGSLSPEFFVASETELNAALAAIDHVRPQLAIIDSIQTLYDASLESAPGTVSQVRACAAALQRIAKVDHLPVFLVGHVTKDGSLAGPRALEHLVDTVLYFEGENQGAFRVLRAVKNRFGATDEIGVFEMREEGLIPVENPSALLLSERLEESPGSVVIPVAEGSRSLLAELQALGTPSYLNNPRRIMSGVDYNRVSLVMAVMEKRLGFRLASHDVFINVAGGVRISEPAADLAILTALAGSMRDLPVTPKTVVFGEVGLGGEVRAVNHAERRLREATRLGFERAVIPARNAERLPSDLGIRVLKVRHVRQALEECLGKPPTIGNEPFE